MRISKNSVTIYDIAQDTGLSPSTISRIINKKGKYSIDTIEKVNSAIKKLDYIPNTKARHLASGSTNTIAVTFPSYSQYASIDLSFYNMFLLGVIENLGNYHYNMLLYKNEINIAADKSDTILYNRNDFDGIIFPIRSSNIINSIPHLISSGTPFVCSSDSSDMSIKGHNIYGGYYLYIHEVLQIFYDKGYRNVIMFFLFSNDLQYYRAKSIIEAFVKEHAQDNFTCRLSIYAPEDAFQFSTMLDGYMHSQIPPDAIFIANTDSCITTYNLLQKAGYRIPEDVAIIGTAFSTTGGSEFYPALSTIYVNAYEMGYRSVDLLFNLIRPEQNKIIDEYIPFQYIDRDSTR